MVDVSQNGESLKYFQDSGKILNTGFTGELETIFESQLINLCLKNS